MTARAAVATRAGILYLLVAIIAPINHFYLTSRFFVADDPTGTAANIVAEPLLYRLGLVAGLASAILFLFVVLNLVTLLRDVDRHLARIMLTLVIVGVGLAPVNLLLQFAPLILLRGSSWLDALDKPQLEVLAALFVQLHDAGNLFAITFWALWLYPFGRLVMKSGWMPRSLGLLLIVGCCAYLAVSLAGIAFPAYLSTVNSIAMPFYAAGELWAIFWLLIRGPRLAAAAG